MSDPVDEHLDEALASLDVRRPFGGASMFPKGPVGCASPSVLVVEHGMYKMPTIVPSGDCSLATV